MGTRSITKVYASETPVINLYRQYDGYPQGHGAELADWLKGFVVGNGLTAQMPKKFANGMGCLAAQLVSNFKGSSPGQFYLLATDVKDAGQDYEYHVYETLSKLRVRITNRGCNMFGMTMSDKNESIFDGTVAELAAFCTEKETA